MDDLTRKMRAEMGPWYVSWGIHKGTLMSRDMGDPIKNLPDLEACVREADRLRRTNWGFGYMIWFVTAHGPNGESVTLASNPYV